MKPEVSLLPPQLEKSVNFFLNYCKLKLTIFHSITEYLFIYTFLLKSRRVQKKKNNTTFHGLHVLFHITVCGKRFSHFRKQSNICLFLCFNLAIIRIWLCLHFFFFFCATDSLFLSSTAIAAFQEKNTELIYWPAQQPGLKKSSP